MKTAGAVLTFRPVRGDRVRVGLRSLFVDAPAVELGLEVGTILWMEVPLPSGVTIRPLVEITGVDEEWFAADYAHIEGHERAAIEAYYASRPSKQELLMRAVRAAATELAASERALAPAAEAVFAAP